MNTTQVGVPGTQALARRLGSRKFKEDSCRQIWAEVLKGTLFFLSDALHCEQNSTTHMTSLLVTKCAQLPHQAILRQSWGSCKLIPF